MGLLSWILVGLVGGSLAQSVTGQEKKGCAYTLVIGVIGALIGGYLFNRSGTNSSLTGFNLKSVFTAFIGACVLCFAMKFLSRRR
jgi:uncharacterized membrane protein YeaQ/YmgE (transglycosylase-associated protein family)